MSLISNLFHRPFSSASEMTTEPPSPGF
jgi:hypothetical protein